MSISNVSVLEGLSQPRVHPFILGVAIYFIYVLMLLPSYGQNIAGPLKVVTDDSGCQWVSVGQAKSVRHDAQGQPLCQIKS